MRISSDAWDKTKDENRKAAALGNSDVPHAHQVKERFMESMDF